MEKLEYKTFTKEYKFIRKIKTDYFGEASLMKNMITKKIFQVKEEEFNSEKNLYEKLSSLNLLSPLLSNPFFLNSSGFAIDEFDSIYERKTFFHLFTIYECLNNDTLERICDEYKKNDKIFEESIVWDILEGLLMAIKKLSFLNRDHRNMNLRNIFLKKNKPKIVFSYNHQFALDRVRKKEIAIYDCFLSPEELSLSFPIKDHENILNTNKCDIFSIGAIILHICTLKNNEYIYCLCHPFINSLSIKNKLDLVKNIYNKDLALIISTMMEENPILRPDFDDLLQKIKIIKESKFLEPLFSKTFLRTPQKNGKHQDKSSKSSEKKAICNLTDLKIIKNFRKQNFSSFVQSNKSNDISKENERDVSTIKISKQSLSDHKILGDLSFLQRKGSVEKNMKVLSKSKGKCSETGQINLEKKINFDLPKRFFDSDKSEKLLKSLEKKLIWNKNGFLRKNIQRIEYLDGSIYFGEIRDGKREGKGIYYFANKEVYGGEWKNDALHGKGTYLYNNGDIYEGDCFEGLKQGKGIYSYKNGEQYQGEWFKNQKKGFGIYNYKNNDIFEGLWSDNEKNGEGAYFFNNGDRFEGFWENETKKGKGKVFFADCSVFEGYWDENSPNGFGCLKYSNGDVFEGNFKCGIKEGEGVYFFQEGAKYDGTFRNDEENGKGVYFYSNHEKYIGSIKNGERHGFGEYFYAGNKKYFGEWKRNKRHGTGKLILSDKSYYEGEWKDGKRFGFGIMYYENGDIYEGHWNENKKEGLGIYKWLNGRFYKGEWKNDKMDGKGRMTGEDGKERMGIWEGNKIEFT